MTMLLVFFMFFCIGELCGRQGEMKILARFCEVLRHLHMPESSSQGAHCLPDTEGWHLRDNNFGRMLLACIGFAARSCSARQRISQSEILLPGRTLCLLLGCQGEITVLLLHQSCFACFGISISPWHVKE